MIIKVVLSVTMFLLYTFYTLPVHTLSQDKNKIKISCYSNTLRGDKCYNTKYKHCSSIGGNYKQCSNNIIHKLTCDCQNRSFELCRDNEKVSEECFYKQYNKFQDTKIYPEASKKNNRVNIYNSYSPASPENIAVTTSI